jgi:hypothetical protein
MRVCGREKSQAEIREKHRSVSNDDHS